jgi:hypothetical protein
VLTNILDCDRCRVNTFLWQYIRFKPALTLQNAAVLTLNIAVFSRSIFIEFRIILYIHRAYFSKQHSPIYLYNGDAVCYVWDRNLISRYYVDEFQASGS